jgi:hypothetical protein
VLQAPVPITTAQRSRSGRSIATCWTIADPSELPTIATGGSQTASISSAVSRANASIGHGCVRSHVVSPMPRPSKVVDR